tara:strand:+ start:2303 stop:3124 length:822 start_codon:yes stop_codon:yes gene_type:complete
MKYNYSVIILNWKRPTNVMHIVDKIHDYSEIKEIVISNGHPNNILNFKQFDKVICYDDSIFNTFYGLDLRFLRGSHAKYNKLIFMDDDVLLENDNLTKLLMQYELNPNKIVGYEGRSMDHDLHYGKVPAKSVECDIVLTRLLVCDKILCELFFRCKPLVEAIYREGIPYGNGEDILLSFIAKIYYNIDKHSLVHKLYITELPNQNSINAHPSHLEYRKKLCCYLKKNKKLFRQVICDNKSNINTGMYNNINRSSIKSLYKPNNKIGFGFKYTR